MKYILSLILILTLGFLITYFAQNKKSNNIGKEPSKSIESQLKFLSEIMNIYIGEEDFDIQFGPKSNIYGKSNILSDTSWFNNDISAYFEDEFIEIAGESDGSSYLLWYYPKLIGEPPIVYLTSDGDGSTIAPSMTEFICLLANSGDFYPRGKKSKDIWTKLHPDYLEVIQDSDPVAYKGRMKRMELAKTTLSCNSFSNILKNFKKHPNFHEWLNKAIEKDEQIGQDT